MSYDHTSHAQQPGMLTLDLDAMGVPAQSHQEAPCSCNSRVDIGGMQIQVTGRGVDAREMARNFRESVQALWDEFAPKAPTMAEQVSALKAAWLEKAVLKGNIDCAQRIIKAAALVLAGAVTQSSDQALWTVASQTDPATSYHVTLMTREDGSLAYLCTCPDSTHRSTAQDQALCKHGLAIAIYRKLN